MKLMSKKDDAYLMTRGEHYSIKVAVPKELIGQYKSKHGVVLSEITQALGTTNKTTARMHRDSIVGKLFEDFNSRISGIEHAPSTLKRLEIGAKELTDNNLTDDEYTELHADMGTLSDHYAPDTDEPDENEIERLAEVRHKLFNRASISFINEQYLKERHQVSSSMKSKMRKYSKALSGFLGGDKEVKRITGRHARDFLSMLNQMTDIAAKTKKDTASGLDKLWSWARRHEFVDNNIFEGARDAIHTNKRGVAKARYPFSNEDTVEILNGIQKLPKHREMLTSIALLGLYSGVRISELANLKTEDVLEGHIFDIKAGKNNAAVRRIPTHKKMHKLIDALVETSRDGWLIPNVPEVKTPRGIYVSGRFSAYKQGFWGHNARPTLTYHSFRHRIEDLFREAEVPTSISSMLTGRTEAGSAAGYGVGVVTIKKMQKALNKIKQGQEVTEVTESLIQNII